MPQPAGPTATGYTNTTMADYLPYMAPGGGTSTPGAGGNVPAGVSGTPAGAGAGGPGGPATTEYSISFTIFIWNVNWFGSSGSVGGSGGAGRSAAQVGAAGLAGLKCKVMTFNATEAAANRNPLGSCDYA